jgi:predicted permease
MKLDLLLSDIKVAGRSLSRDPRYALVVVLTLALGISAGTVIFSIMNPYLVRELQFRDSENLYQIGHVDSRHNWNMGRFSIAQMEDLRQQSESLEALGAYRYGKRNLIDESGAEQIMASFLTVNLFDILGMPPLVGRSLNPNDDRAESPRVVVISNTLWQKRYGGRTDILGRVISLNDQQFEIVGVMPREFDFPFGEVRAWLPISTDIATSSREQQWHHLIARLKPEVSYEEAVTELNGIHAQLRELYPDEDGRYSGIAVVPIREALNFAYEVLRYSFLSLLTAVTLLLLLACANVASLTLARATSRSKEVAIRAAVGAKRSRLVSQLFVEGLVLAGLACVVGVGMSVMVLRAVAPTLPAEALFKTGDFTVDLNVLLYAVGVSLLTPLVFCLMPALRATRSDLFSGLRDGSRTASDAARSRRVLVVVETAIAIVLVSGAALAARALVNASQMDVGFLHENILAVEMTLPEDRFASDDEVNQFFRETEQHLARVRGVHEVGRITRLPLNHETSTTGIALPGSIPDVPEQLSMALADSVSETYLSTMKIPVVAGRTFTAESYENRGASVVISKSVADRFWPGESPVGRTVMVGEFEELRPAAIIGIVGNVKTEGLENPELGHVYTPIPAQRRQFFVLNTEASPPTLISPIREKLGVVAPDIPVLIRPMTEVVRESMLQWAITSLFFSVFGSIALMLTTLGIYGVMAYSVARRTREFGIRMAVGATSPRLSRMVLVEGLKLTGIGIGIGLSVSFVLALIVGRVVTGIDPADVVSYLIIVCLFGVISIIASLGPARRASRCDPQAVLRFE